jgi:hypothetical protein
MPVEEMLQTFQNLEESECKNGFFIVSLCPIIFTTTTLLYFTLRALKDSYTLHSSK